MKKPILSILLLLSFSLTLHAELKINIKQNEVLTMPDSSYVFLNHLTQNWDFKKSSFPAAQMLLDFSKAKQIKSIATVHSEAFIEEHYEKQYLVTNENTDFIMRSDGGHHRLKFPDVKTVYVGGGNLTLCLCEAVRDIVSGMLPLKSDKKIFLIREAIYDTDFVGMPKNEEELLSFFETYYLPNFPCPDQVSTDFGPIDLSGANLKIYSNKNLVKNINTNPGGFNISIYYINWKNIEETM